MQSGRSVRYKYRAPWLCNQHPALEIYSLSDIFSLSIDRNLAQEATTHVPLPKPVSTLEIDRWIAFPLTARPFCVGHKQSMPQDDGPLNVTKETSEEGR